MKRVHHKLRNIIQSNDVPRDPRLPAEPWDPGRSLSATEQHMSTSLFLCKAEEI